MKVTVEKTQAAIKVLVGGIILPKHAPMEVYEHHWECVEKSIQAAIDASDEVD